MPKCHVWTLPCMAAEQPGAKVVRVQRLSKVWCFITGGEVIFHQSISNDHKRWRASMVYYQAHSKWPKQEKGSFIFSLAYGLMSLNSTNQTMEDLIQYNISYWNKTWRCSMQVCAHVGAHEYVCVSLSDNGALFRFAADGVSRWNRSPSALTPEVRLFDGSQLGSPLFDWRLVDCLPTKHECERDTA